MQLVVDLTLLNVIISTKIKFILSICRYDLILPQNYMTIETYSVQLS